MSACSWRTRRSLQLAQRHCRSQGIILLRSLSNVRTATSKLKCGNVRSTCLTVLSMVVTCHFTHRAIPLWPYSHWKIFFFFRWCRFRCFQSQRGLLKSARRQWASYWRIASPNISFLSLPFMSKVHFLHFLQGKFNSASCWAACWRMCPRRMVPWR